MKPPRALVRMDKSYLDSGNWRCPGRPQQDSESDEEYAGVKATSTTAHHTVIDNEHAGVCVNCGEERNGKVAAMREEQAYDKRKQQQAEGAARFRASHKKGGQARAEQRRVEN